jgi:hypothetical protein
VSSTKRILAALVAVCCALPSTVAWAADSGSPTTTAAPDPTAASGGFAVQPSGPKGPGGRDYFVYELAAGQSFSDVVGVSNNTDAPLKFALYSTDAFNTPGDGGYALLKEQDKPVDLGTWIKLKAPEYTVPAHSRADIPFSVTVPLAATPGDHAGAILAEPEQEAPTSSGGAQLQLRTRVGARVYVRVAGPVEPALNVEAISLTVDTPWLPFAKGSGVVNYRIRNAGNIRIKAGARVTVSGPFGITVKKTAIEQLPELLPGSELLRTVRLSGLPAAFRLSAKLNLTTEVVKADTSRTAVAWSVPWWVLVFLAIVLAASYLWVRRRRKAREARA